MSYTDAEMMMATQIAYLDVKGNGRNSSTKNMGDIVDAVLQKYGTYDRTTGTYTMKEGVTGGAKAQFETAQNILTLSKQNNVVSWRHWKVVDSCNNQNSSGYYGCLIDTGDGNAIIGCRGSESYDDQTFKDWGMADLGRLNNEQTAQQADAAAYMNYLYREYGNDYEQYSFTGHSLGGSLATHAAITAPEGMQDRIDTVISFDGPGFSNEYLAKHAKQIERVRDKLNHYEYSWVGTLLLQPQGIRNMVIKAHDDNSTTDIFSIFKAQLFRHATNNVEFDKNGNIMPGEQGVLQKLMGPVSIAMELMPEELLPMFLIPYVMTGLGAYFISVADQIKQQFDEIVQNVKQKTNDLFQSYMNFVVSGDYEVCTSDICALTESLETIQQRLNGIAGEVEEIKQSLPYDSTSAMYYKNALGLQAMMLKSEGKTAKKVADVLDKAVVKYNQGDQKVAALF